MPQKWSAIFLLIFCLMLMAIGAGGQTFQSPNGYSITAPLGWSFANHGLMGSDVFIFAKPQSQFANNLNVFVGASPAGLTLKQEPARVSALYPKSNIGYKFISGKFTTVDGQPAYETIYNSQYGTPSRLLWQRQEIIIRGGKMYVFTCTALAANATHYTSGFSAILKSVHWIGK